MDYRKLACALRGWTRDSEGQALAEYGLILALVLMSLVGALALLGGSFVTPFTTFVDAAGIGGS